MTMPPHNYGYPPQVGRASRRRRIAAAAAAGILITVSAIVTAAIDGPGIPPAPSPTTTPAAP